MKKYILPLLLIVCAMIFAGCGGSGTDDSGKNEKMRMLSDSDKITFRQQDTDTPAEYVFTFVEKDIKIADSDDTVSCEIIGSNPRLFEDEKTAPADWNYWKTVQLSDGSVCDLGGILDEENNILTVEYKNLLCPPELEIGTTWVSCGTTYTVTDYQYVCDDTSDAYGAFVVESTGAVSSKIWWAAEELGFPVKCIYDGSTTKISKYEDLND